MGIKSKGLDNHRRSSHESLQPQKIFWKWRKPSSFLFRWSNMEHRLSFVWQWFTFSRQLHPSCGLLAPPFCARTKIREFSLSAMPRRKDTVSYRFEAASPGEHQSVCKAFISLWRHVPVLPTIDFLKLLRKRLFCLFCLFFVRLTVTSRFTRVKKDGEMDTIWEL